MSTCVVAGCRATCVALDKVVPVFRWVVSAETIRVDGGEGGGEAGKHTSLTQAFVSAFTVGAATTAAAIEGEEGAVFGLARGCRFTRARTFSNSLSIGDSCEEEEEEGAGGSEGAREGVTVVIAG